MGLFENLFGDDKKTSMEAFGILSYLEEEEQKEVKKGNYNTWNFEEEEREEDDYYYEDDE